MGEIAAAMAESKLENSELMRKMAVSEVEKRELIRMMLEVREMEGARGVSKFIVKRMMDLEEKETGGDDFLFWMEANAIDSMKRINSLDPKLCDFYAQCGKFAIDRYLYKWIPAANADKEALFTLGMSSDESLVLQYEYFKSLAELCIKKMRLRALVDKCDKRTTLILEISRARTTWKKLRDLFSALSKGIADIRIQLEQDPHASPEIANGLIEKHLEPGSSILELRGNYKYRADAFGRESFRVLVEMMRDVKVGGQLPPHKGLDDAMELGKRWTEAVMGMCVMKLMLGTMAEGRSIFEVLKSLIAENWKMERELKDRIAAFQMEHARLAQGFVTDTVGKGDESIKEKNSGLGAVVKGGETVEEVTVVEGDETIDKDKKRFATMSGDKEETKLENSKAKTKLRMFRLDNIGLISTFILIVALLFAWFQGQEKGGQFYPLQV